MDQTDQPNQPHQPARHPAEPGSAEGRVVVLISIAMVGVMFVSMVALLYWRWRQNPAPSSLLVLRVPQAYDGAVATVDVADGRDLRPLVTTLQANKTIRISLPPGTYTVKIDYKGRRLATVDEIQMKDYLYFPVILPRPSATQETP